MQKIAGQIPGYTYGTTAVGQSPVSVEDFDRLRAGAGFTEEDSVPRLAGEILANQTKQIVQHLRGAIIAGIPHLGKHSRTPEEEAIPEYLAASNLRFQQWILDTCLRPSDGSHRDPVCSIRGILVQQVLSRAEAKASTKSPRPSHL